MCDSSEIWCVFFHLCWLTEPGYGYELEFSSDLQSWGQQEGAVVYGLGQEVDFLLYQGQLPSQGGDSESGSVLSATPSPVSSFVLNPFTDGTTLVSFHIGEADEVTFHQAIVEQDYRGLENAITALDVEGTPSGSHTLIVFAIGQRF